MLLEELLENRIERYVYLERFVNRGSPSGFVNSEMSKEYHPFTGDRSYMLPLFKPSDLEVFSSKSFPLNVNFLPLHPDIAKRTSLTAIDHIEVYPLASPRTVLEVNNRYYLKLHFTTIGRSDRRITKNKILRTIFFNDLLSQFKNSSFDYFSDSVGVWSASTDMGAIFREPYLKPSEQGIIIPAFSLFSEDKYRTQDPLLIKQLIDIDEENYFRLIRCLIDFYIDAVFKLGVIPTAHSQNVLFKITSNGCINRVIYRDLLDLRVDSQKYPHVPNYVLSTKELEGKDLNKFYSCMFDFKFGEYLLSPLNDCIQKRNFAEDFISELSAKLTKDELKEKFYEVMSKKAYGYSKVKDIWVNGRPVLEEIPVRFR